MENMNFNERIAELVNGLDEGYCRICGKWAKLSEDHVPPRACGNKNKIEIIYSENKKLISQNGLKCKTICENCNSSLLGGNYDKSLIHLYNDVNSIKKIILNKREFNVNVKSLVRCILGHFIALNVYEKDETVQETLKKEPSIENKTFTKYRNFVTGNDDELENTLCYYWYYKYDDIKIYPYICKLNIITKMSILGALIKIKPIALFIVDTKHSSITYKDIPTIDFNVNRITFNYRNSIRYDFPQMPYSNEVILLNSGSSFNIDKVIT
jgi:hypothetical protein